jgi:2-polyprenyl-6-methoxyphenol hydroxylase-like FAD-dependent oxidoreductase
MGTREIIIARVGPAGAAAAITARQEGSHVQLIERAKASRHKVCGEFISSGAREFMDAFHLWNAFASLGPCPPPTMRATPWEAHEAVDVSRVCMGIEPAAIGPTAPRQGCFGGPWYAAAKHRSQFVTG